MYVAWHNWETTLAALKSCTSDHNLHVHALQAIEFVDRYMYNDFEQGCKIWP